MRKFLWKTIILFSIPTLLSGCFTGIEGTKKIELSKDDVKATAPSDEEIFWSDIKGIPFSEWQAGKRFIATDDRVALAFDQQGLPADYESLHLGGKVFNYLGTDKTMLPNGAVTVVLDFECDGRKYRYNTKGDEARLASLTSAELPMLVDMDIICQADAKIRGKQVWTRSSLWYDAEGNRLQGNKFVPVTITGVQSGSSQFPLLVSFTDENGQQAWMWMSIGNSPLDSRSFGNLFSLTDIKKKYPKIDPEVWTLIQHGQVREGMTKEECKLSLGNPTKVETGHDYSQTIDIWVYSDGHVLRFLDGLLTSDRF